MIIFHLLFERKIYCVQEVWSFRPRVCSKFRNYEIVVKCVILRPKFIYFFRRTTFFFFQKANFETIVVDLMPTPTLNFIKIENGDHDLLLDLIWRHPTDKVSCKLI